MNAFDTRETDDGSLTFFSSEFGETFHSKFGAKKEAEIVYVEGCQLSEKAQTQSALKIIDICYGLGYNTAAALDSIWTTNPNCHVEIIALELDQRVPLQALDNQLLNYWSTDIVKLLTDLVITKSISNKNLQAQLFIEDARITIQKLAAKNLQADAIFLDPFSPPQCPQLWTVEFLNLVANCLNSEGIIATYSGSAAIRTALQLAGLNIGPNKCLGRKSPGTIASFTKKYLIPLSLREREHLKTRAAIPYRDPFLSDSMTTIQQRRAEEQKISTFEPTSQWKKRWFSQHQA
jgi:tRNA U34 5-methylaminomethyl-2-thiouridine-forming methyltransferase MnmC